MLSCTLHRRALTVQGAMLDAGLAHLVDAPHLTLFPGASIPLAVLGFNLPGDGLRDWLSPR